MIVYEQCEYFGMLMVYVCVLCAAFCITYSLLILVEDARGDHMEEAYSGAGLMTVLRYIFLFTPSCCSECFYYLLKLMCVY